MNERGSTFLELVMFSPLALLLVAAFVDGGLYLVDRAAVRESLHAGLLDHGEFELFRAANSSPLINGEELELAATTMQERLHSHLSMITGYAPNTFGSTLALVEIRGLSSSTPSAVVLYQTHSLPSLLLQNAPRLSETIEQELATRNSPLLGSSRLDRQLYLAGEVSAISRGVFPGLTKLFLGHPPVVREFTITPVRALSG